MKTDLYASARITKNLQASKLYMWRYRTLYFGQLPYVAPHKYGSSILIAGLDAPFHIRLSGSDWRACSCCILPAGVTHEIQGPIGVLGKLFIEGGSSDYLCLLNRFEFQRQCRFFLDAEVISTFNEIYHKNCSYECAGQKLDDLLDASTVNSCKLDTRINQSIQFIEHDLSDNLNETYLAKRVGLSVSRFRHLFTQEMGVPYQNYRIWRRLLSAAKGMGTEDRLTNAALDNGFTDLSHFSNHYKKVFGVNPSFVFKDLQDFYV